MICGDLFGHARHALAAALALNFFYGLAVAEPVVDVGHAVVVESQPAHETTSDPG